MKIVHICLACVYVEGFGYQENILPQQHRKMGFDVVVLTNDNVFNSKYEQIKREEKDYVNDYGVHVIALKRAKRYGYLSRFGDYAGVLPTLTRENPDVVFVHGGQFFALKDVIAYCKKRPNVKLYIDQHGDYYNTPLKTWKARLVYKRIYGHWMRKAIPYVRKYWGVTPWRCEYLRDVYKIPEEKIDLLVMGGEDEKIRLNRASETRREVRARLGLSDDDFVVITGGKIDRTKNIHRLAQAVIDLKRDNVKLIVFGRPNDEMEPEIERLSQNERIRNIGWMKSDEVYDYFLASDLVAFPGTHSVLWEQACACGIPVMVKEWPGMRHVDLGGNCFFLQESSEEEMTEYLLDLCDKGETYRRALSVAQKGIDVFSYEKIAKRAIEWND